MPSYLTPIILNVFLLYITVSPSFILPSRIKGWKVMLHLVLKH